MRDVSAPHGRRRLAGNFLRGLFLFSPVFCFSLFSLIARSTTGLSRLQLKEARQQRLAEMQQQRQQQATTDQAKPDFSPRVGPK